MNTGNRARLKNGQVVTVVGRSAGSYLCSTAEGDLRSVNPDQVCHILGTECATCDPKKEDESEK